MAVNFGTYSGYKELSDKGDKAVSRIVDAYAGKIKQDRADEMLQREDAIREAKTLSDETGKVHKMNKTVTDFSDKNVDVKMPSFKDGSKSFLSQSWDALKGTAGNINRNVKRDKTEYGVEDTGNYTNRYKENMERKTQYIDSNNDGTWGNEGDERTQIGKDADYTKNEDFKRKQADAFIRDGKSGIVKNNDGTNADEYNTGANGVFDPMSSQKHQYSTLVDEANIEIESKLESLDTDSLLDLSFGKGDGSVKAWMEKNGFGALKPADILSIKNSIIDPSISKRMKTIQQKFSGMTETEIEEWSKANPKDFKEYVKLNSAISGKNTSLKSIKKDLGNPDKWKEAGISKDNFKNSSSMIDYAYSSATGSTKDRNSTNKTVTAGKENTFGAQADLSFKTEKTKTGRMVEPSDDLKLLFAALPDEISAMNDTSLDNMELKEEKNGKTYLIESDMFFDDKVEVKWDNATGKVMWKDDESNEWYNISDDYDGFNENF